MSSRQATTRAAGWLLAAALLPAASAHALDPQRAVTQYVMRAWGTQQGLPHGSVSAILQTRDGFVWVGTYQGLARFDGVAFTILDSSSSGLQDNVVRALAEDADGSLLVGTTSGGLFRVRGREVTPAGLAGSVYALLRARDGVVWIGTESGLVRLDHRPLPGGEALRDRHVTALSEAADGTIWLGTSRGLARVRAGVAEVVGWVGEARVQSLLADRRGRMWVGADYRLERFDAEGHATLVEPTSDNPIAALFEDRDGSIWAGTYGDGLHRFGPGDSGPQIFDPPRGFPDRRAWALAEDREGNLWVGTRVGLVQLRDGPVTSYSQLEGLPADVVRAVYEDRDGTLLIGTEGGAARFTAGQGLSPIAGVPASRVAYAFLRDREGALWVGGIGSLTRLAGAHVNVFGAREGVPDERVKVLVEDRRGRVWAGTGRGVIVRAAGAASFERWPQLEPLAHTVIETLLEDHQGTLWIGTELDGLWRFRDGKLAAVPLRGAAAFGVRSLHEEADGTLLVGSSGAGLFIRRGEGWVRLSTAEGLHADALWSLVDDGVGGLFISSDVGVFRILTRELLEFAEGRRTRVESFLTLGTADGMKTAECNGGGGSPGLRTRDGRMWFPTQRGAVVFDPQALLGNALPPAVVIDEVVLDRRSVWRDPAADTFVVPAGTRDIEIRYTALSFADPAKLRFRYRLEDHDEVLLDAGARRTAYYSNLPPGHHVFQVLACNNAGLWSPHGARITLDVQPLPSQRWSVRVSAMALALGLAIFGVRRRVGRLSRQKTELQALVEERTHSLALANASLQQLATMDALTGVANRRRLDDMLEQEWARAVRDGGVLSLLLVDVDMFKSYNDHYGHQAGDACLARIGEVLRSAGRRAGDLPARYGGEEFVLVLPGAPLSAALEIAESIRAAVASLDIAHGFSTAADRVTISVGVACLHPKQGDRAGELVAEADRALYRAKDTGRNRVCSAAQQAPQQVGGLGAEPPTW